MRGNTKRILFLITAIAALMLMVIAPLPEGLTVQGKNLLGLLLFVAFMWIGDVMPKSVTALLAVVLMSYLGITASLSATVKEYANTMLFFLVAAFALAAITKRSSLPRLAMGLLFRFSGAKTGRIIIGFMAVTAIISAIMSDIAAAALVFAVASSLFQSEEIRPHLSEPEINKLMKCVMMGIPIGSLAGGLMTPNGSPTSLTLMGTMEQLLGVSLPYLQWMFIGIPLCLTTLVFAWIAMMACYKPGQIDQKLVSKFIAVHGKDVQDIDRMYDAKTVAIIIIMLSGWIAGSFVPFFNSTAVAIFGMVCMFLPGINLLKFNDFTKEVPWDTVFMLGGLFVVSNAMNETGARAWLVDQFMALTSAFSPTMVLLTICVFVAVVRAFLPAGPPLVCTASLILYGYAASVGLNPVATMFCLVYWAEPTFLMPCFDAVYLVTYGNGEQYSIRDLARFGVALTLFLLIFNLLFIPALVDLSYMFF